ncbi:peptidoglycan DD-metalloendopeptidase family protein [Nocardioides mesophilus]|uniref:Peptidoglycan DD-metalloendopeptidase family protein n=2 Tax=Nocardioides mesophilus TaxID=433659 RepID=A0A7G9RD64_9ACTN|nr:peptidoglycan DD-metalloendopeptidase family protein [Nocardioides mesophilus]
MMAAVAAGSMVLGLAAVPLASADDLRHKKAKVERNLSGAHDDLEESSGQLRAATAALQAAEAQLGQAQAKLARTRGELAAAEALDRQMQAKLEAAIAKLARARADLEQGHAKIAEQEHELGQIVVQNYQSGDPSLMGLSMVLTSQDPSALTGQLNSVRNVIDKEAVTLSRLEASKVLLTVQEQQVEEAKAEVAVQRRAAARNLERKQRLEQAAEDAETQVRSLVSLRKDARVEAEKARQADLATLQSLEFERDRIAAILRQRAEEARRRAAAAAAAADASGANVPVYGGSGELLRPVPGPVTSPFGWRTHPIYGYRSLHDGIDFGAACGTPIEAAASGVVIEKYFQTAYGNRVVIDHGIHRGVSIATISNHLSSYAVSVGDHVRRGQVIGYVGTTGWSTGCHLHWTVLQNGSPVDPANWI